MSPSVANSSKPTRRPAAGCRATKPAWPPRRSAYGLPPCRSPSLDKKTVAEAIRGKAVDRTNFGKVSFSPNGQMLTQPALFRVLDGKDWKIELVK